MRIIDLFEDDNEKVAGPISSFVAGWKDGGKTKNPKVSVASKEKSPFDSYDKYDLKKLFKKIIDEQPLDRNEIRIVKGLYKKFL